ncbi:unnamed protein product [Parnassius apollo]|uniref:(apollo) hypothetical protein n=1 Tax=Parnassius apollo TaxID=110799 RepID=A0A8S3WTY0_PARAO|nr:unnamed protein product [Parnassius apollo]
MDAYGLRILLTCGNPKLNDTEEKWGVRPPQIGFVSAWPPGEPRRRVAITADPDAIPLVVQSGHQLPPCRNMMGYNSQGHGYNKLFTQLFSRVRCAARRISFVSKTWIWKGWFDGNTFEDWVETVALPYFNNKTGKKILIGDNLSSHLSLDLIKKCQQQEVHFVFLTPNSTHLTQPLDVAFFRPVKIAWRNILFTWKKSEGRVMPTIPKNVFPKLLKQLLNKMEPNTKQNILAGFMKAGISPLNKDKVLNRLPGNNLRHEFCLEEKEAIDESVLSLLKEMRYGPENTRTIRKPKKINVIPRKSVEDSDYVESDISSSNALSDVDSQVAKDQRQKDTQPKIRILSDVIYKGNMKKTIELKASANRLKKSNYYENNLEPSLKPKPSICGLRRPRYYKDDV